MKKVLVLFIAVFMLLSTIAYSGCSDQERSLDKGAEYACIKKRKNMP